jgi:hypothetical protein
MSLFPFPSLRSTGRQRSSAAQGQPATGFSSCPLSARPRPSGKESLSWEELLGRR